VNKVHNNSARPTIPDTCRSKRVADWGSSHISSAVNYSPLPCESDEPRIRLWHKMRCPVLANPEAHCTRVELTGRRCCAALCLRRDSLAIPSLALARSVTCDERDLFFACVCACLMVESKRMSIKYVWPGLAGIAIVLPYLKLRMVRGLYDLWLCLWDSLVPQKSFLNISHNGVTRVSSLLTIASVSSKTKSPS